MICNWVWCNNSQSSNLRLSSTLCPINLNLLDVACKYQLSWKTFQVIPRSRPWLVYVVASCPFFLVSQEPNAITQPTIEYRIQRENYSSNGNMVAIFMEDESALTQPETMDSNIRKYCLELTREDFIGRHIPHLSWRVASARPNN